MNEIVTMPSYPEITHSSYVFALWFMWCSNWLISLMSIVCGGILECDNYYNKINSHSLYLLRYLIQTNIHTPDIILAQW